MENILGTTPPTELPHHKISGLTGEQADTFVELAYANKQLADVVSSDPNGLSGLDAREQLQVNEACLKRLGNIALGRSEDPYIAYMEARNTDSEQSRVGLTHVVNPRDGRIVPYGQMQHGDHPHGGMIARR